MTDRATGLSRGFAFVEMAAAEAGQAITALNGETVDGRTIEVREGRPTLHRRGVAPGGPAQQLEPAAS
jgi:RNA recognition motif-containing protein